MPRDRWRSFGQVATATPFWRGRSSRPRPTSSGGKICGSVRGTRASGARRDFRDLPWRRVDRPRGTRLTCTGVSRDQVGVQADTDGNRRATVRAVRPESRSASRPTLRSRR